jgi:hypothetical protein
MHKSQDVFTFQNVSDSVFEDVIQNITSSSHRGYAAPKESYY